MCFFLGSRVERIESAFFLQKNAHLCEKKVSSKAYITLILNNIATCTLLEKASKFSKAH